MRRRNGNRMGGRLGVSRGRGFGTRSGMRRMDTCRQGFRVGNGRGICLNTNYSEGDKELLTSQKEFLEERVASIEEELESL